MPNGASTPIIDHEELRPVLRSIARDTSVEVVLKDVAMEVYGLEEQVKRAITTINDINMIQVSFQHARDGITSAVLSIEPETKVTC